MKVLETDLHFLRSVHPMEIAEINHPEKYAELLKENMNVKGWLINSIKGRLQHIKQINPKKFERTMKHYQDVIAKFKIIKINKPKMQNR